MLGTTRVVAGRITRIAKPHHGARPDDQGCRRGRHQDAGAGWPGHAAGECPPGQADRHRPGPQPDHGGPLGQYPGNGAYAVPPTSAVGDALNNGIPARLYHYTNEAGLNGILDSGQLNPSLKALNPNDVRYDNGSTC